MDQAAPPRPYYLVFYDMQSAIIIFSALYAKCPYYLVLDMQSALVILLYVKCPYYLVFHMQSVLII